MKKIGWLLIICFACSTNTESEPVDIQGHRGARGLAPENSIPGFIMAVEMGVTTLELDLVVSGDNQLVVSHEPYFSPHFCLDTDGNPLSDTVINMYQLDYSQIQAFDCGMKDHPRFPDQKRISVYKPLLSDVIDSVENHTKRLGRAPLFYNIELKTSAETDSAFHPHPHEFSDFVYDLITEKGIWDRVNIQSFDFRTLQYFNEKYPDVKLAALIEAEDDWETNIEELGFTPEIYSCYYLLLSRKNIKEIQSAGMKVIPWTVNEATEIKKLIDWGVDGIITDYPDRALTIINNDE